MEQIGRFQVTGILGKGAMGVVYRAVDPAIGRTVAIKTIRLQEFGDDSQGRKLRERLFREARSAGALSHPNIVTIYDIAEVDGNAYIFMEFVDGPTLDKLVSSEPAPSRESLLRLLQQIAGALDYAHSKGIVHRDIKPPNILVHESSVAKIADFGVARIENQQVTQAGMIVGTPNYMSPEQIQGAGVDGRTDQYSLGVIAYELLTGEKPFIAESMPTLLFKIIREAPTPVEHLNPSLNEPVDLVLQKVLSKGRDDRYSDCRSFVDALQDALNSSPKWQALTPGSSLTMPTVGGETSVSAQGLSRSGFAAPPPPPPPVAPTVAAAAARPVRRLDEDEAVESRPGRKLIWIAVPLVLVALALAAFQYSRRQPSTVADQSPADTPAVDSTKPAIIPPTVPTVPAVKKPAATTTASSTVPPRTPDGEEKTKPVTPPKPPPTSAGAVNFQLMTSPSGVAVVFDGNNALTCTSPCSVQLPAGSHSLSGRLDGYRPVYRRFNLPDEPEITLGMDKRSGKVFVRSTPPGAQVFIDGQLQSGHTPVSLTLVEGDHEVRVTKDGAKGFSTSVNVKDGGLANLDVELAPAAPTSQP